MIDDNFQFDVNKASESVIKISLLMPNSEHNECIIYNKHLNQQRSPNVEKWLKCRQIM